jgi:predicted kinase
MIIWLNGGFGAGKTTLAEKLREQMPGAVIYDPEQVGAMLWKFLPRNDDFQDLPSWRELVVATAVSLRRHHAATLIVPMSLIRDAYRAEILSGLADAGEEVLHVFLEANGDELKRRLEARGAPPNTPGATEAIRQWAFTRIDTAVSAAQRQPEGTLLLRSDQLSPGELADQVLAAVADRYV